jgi:hypothetical protein
MRNCAYGAGTHNPGRLLVKEAVDHGAKNNIRRGAWVPAFAGTTNRFLRLPQHAPLVRRDIDISFV